MLRSSFSSEDKIILLSWPAILAGALIGVGLNFLLNLLSLGLGIVSFSIQQNGTLIFSFPGYLLFCISGFIAMFMSGWVAGKLTPSHSPKCWGVLYGFLAWALLLTITIILITNFIQYAAFHANFTAHLVAIKITHGQPLLTTSFAHIANLEHTQKILSLNALLTFILFFIGACASCLGGFLGYKPKQGE